MVSIPTLWVVFVVNFLALAMVWTYVVRSYPNFDAARFWAAGAYLGAAGALVSMLRGTVDPLIPIVLGNGLLLFACWLGAMGMLRFYSQPVGWARSQLLTALSVAGLAVFAIWDDIAMRILSYSLGQSLTLAVMLRVVLSRSGIRHNSGARLAGAVAVTGIAVHLLRSASALLRIGGDLTFIDFNTFQAGVILV